MPAEANIARMADTTRTAGNIEHAAAQGTTTFSVGYKNPPAAYRFKKGCSGNPGGRPRKHSKVAGQPTQTDVQQVILKEAYRMVSLREGDKVIKLPAIQAAMRGLGLAAIKGDRRAQLAFKEQTEAVELKQHTEKMELFETYLKYKMIWTAEINRCKALGLPPPAPLPHPDDVKLDVRTGEVRFVGPLDELQKHQWDEVRAKKDNILGCLVYLEDIEGHGSPRERKQTAKGFEFFEQLYLWFDYYRPDEADRRHPSYNYQNRGPPPSLARIRRQHEVLMKSYK